MAKPGNVRLRIAGAVTAAVVAVGGAAAGWIGLAEASIPAANGKIYACFTKSTGALRAISYPSKHCKKGETAITWNRTGKQGAKGARGVRGTTGSQGLQGPAGEQGQQGSQGSQGAQGPQGTQGPQGVQGPAGATTVHVVAGTTGSTTSVASCASGERVVGGGWTGVSDFVIVSAPTGGLTNPSGWQVQVTGGTVQAYAVCVA